MPDAQSRFVKICGVREVEHARTAAVAGADALGFMLAPSRRQVSLDTVRAIRDELGIDRRVPTLVAVTVNASQQEYDDIASSSAIDLVQLSGDEDPEIRNRLGVAFMKAFRFRPGTPLPDALAAIEPWLEHPLSAGRILIDTYDPVRFGGSGRTGDWEFARELASRVPVVLAGGLDATNVPRAILEVDPAGVDVSSGVEVDGRKDSRSIELFIEAARGQVSAAAVPGSS